MRPLALVIVLAASHVAPASGADHHVFAGQSIQAAIVGAANGDRVLVHPGTYLEALDLFGKTIDVIGTDGAALTVIDASGLGGAVVELGGGGSGPRLEGLTLTGGVGVGAGPRNGGGIHGGDSFTCVVRCVVTGNHVTGDGGGIHVTGGTLTLDESDVHGNTAGQDGGGLFTVEDLVVLGGSLVGNQAGRHGGGARVRGHSCVLTDVVIAANVAGIGDGGGVHHERSSEFFVRTAVERCRFHGNVAGARGGGMFGATDTLAPFVFAITTVRATAFSNNTAASEGGGARFDTGGTLSFDHATIAGNGSTSGGAGGVHVANAVTWTVTNTISWANTPSGIGGPKLPSVSTSDTQGNHPGPGNLSADPLLLDVAADDIHLAWTSPCRDQGASPFSPTAFDFEGDPLGADAAEDIGADEFHPHLWLVGPPTLGRTVELKIAGAPGGGPLLLFVGSDLLATPLATPFGDFDLAAPIVTFPLGAFPSGAVYSQSTAIPATAATGELFLQAFTGAAVTNALVVTVRP